jgi:hypothetical protein
MPKLNEDYYNLCNKGVENKDNNNNNLSNLNFKMIDDTNLYQNNNKSPNEYNNNNKNFLFKNPFI